MTNGYFSNFPLTDYKIGEKTYNATDLTAVIKIQALLRDRGTVIYNYTIKDEERPDVLAHNFYGDSYLDWIILLTNRVINPLWDWPISSTNFGPYLEAKYGSIAETHQTVHEYRWITQRETYTSLGERVPYRYVIVDQDRYNSLADLDRELITKYQYEEELNESKRNILVIHKRYVNMILDEKAELLA
jgi:hypothetical protein